MRLLLAVLVLFASAAGAEAALSPPPPPVTDAAPGPQPPAAPPPATAPAWSIGAGLTFFAPVTTQTLTAGMVGLVGGLSLLAPVTPNVSIERLFTPHFALGLGLEASLSTTASATAAPISGSVGFALSPRFILTNVDAPVSFTLYATVFAGYASVALSAAPPLSASAVSLGVAGGIAFERRLIDRLSLRAQASLVRLSLAQVTSATGASAAGTTAISANLIPSPSVELRLYF